MSSGALGEFALGEEGDGSSSISPTGIATGQAFGTALLTLDNHNLLPTAIDTGQAFGTALVQNELVELSPTGIASGQAFGTASLVVNLSPTGIATGQAFGTAIVVRIITYKPVSRYRGASIGSRRGGS
jgi:hypothetical protein